MPSVHIPECAPFNDDRRKIARILASGILRIRPRSGVESVSGRETELASTCLEVPRHLSLSVPTGERLRESGPADVEPN